MPIPILIQFSSNSFNACNSFDLCNDAILLVTENTDDWPYVCDDNSAAYNNTLSDTESSDKSDYNDVDLKAKIEAEKHENDEMTHAEAVERKVGDDNKDSALEVADDFDLENIY